MMRFQTVGPDCPPLNNVKRSISKPTPPIDNSSNLQTNTLKDTNTGTTYRFKSPSRIHDHNSTVSHSGSAGFPNSPPQTPAENHHHEVLRSEKRDASPNRGDMLLQWGQKKRARVSRSEVRAGIDDSTSSSSIQGKQLIGNKVQRRITHPAMPPPPPAPSHTRSSNLRNGSVSSSGFVGNRNFEDLSLTVNGSPSRNSGGNIRSITKPAAGKRSHTSPENDDRKKSCSISANDETLNEPVGVVDRLNHVVSASVQTGKETGVTNAASIGEAVKVEWPRIYIALSRKEKEEDFLAMKGTKLPHRPKKRAKHIDRSLQYCFPGMWLSDLNKSRYEVREKKSVKKQQQRRRGLKGLENMESDSE